MELTAWVLSKRPRYRTMNHVARAGGGRHTSSSIGRTVVRWRSETIWEERRMDHLHQVLGAKVREWREEGYPCDEFPAITEILVGHLVCSLPFLHYGRAPPSPYGPPTASSRPSQSMPLLPSAFPPRRATTAPLKWRRISVPRTRRSFQPLDDLFGTLGIVSFQRPPGEDSPHRLGHVQPGGSQRRVEHHDSPGEHPQ